MNSFSFHARRILLKMSHFMVWFIALVINWGQRKSLPPIKNPVLWKSASKLAEEIREGELKSEEVVQAFIDRILEVQPYINAMVEERFEDALAEAREIDNLIKFKKFTKQQLAEEKPLLGVPFTVKCLIYVKGLKATSGSLLFKDRIATEDAEAVAVLKKYGGIALALTNSPEFGSGIETDNYIYGKTCNPYDTTRTPGGSSGGEAALVSAAASALGIGNDLMGSNRLPAHFCGLFSHKATPGIIPDEGCSPISPLSVRYFLSVGPLCRHAEDLVLVMRILGSESKEKYHHRNTVDFKKLKIYYLTEIRNPWVLKPDEEIIQAVKKASSHFEKKYGAVVKETNIPLLSKSSSIGFYVLVSEIPNVLEQATFGKVKFMNGILETLKWLLGLSDYTFQMIFQAAWLKKPLFFKSKNIPYYKKLHRSLNEKFEELLDENSVFIYPTFPITAPYHKEIVPLLANISYLNVFNLTGMPATQCPIGISKNGMPIGMQIAGRKNNDALTIACAIELEKAFGGWTAPEKIKELKKFN